MGNGRQNNQKFQYIFKKSTKNTEKTSQLYAGNPDGGVLAAAGQEVVRGAGPGAELEPGHRGLVPAQHLQGGPGGARLHTWGRYIVTENTEYRHVSTHPESR